MPNNSEILESLDKADFAALTLFRSGSEYQANLQTERGGGWRVCHGATPCEALAGLFAPAVPLVCPAPPY